MQSNSNSLTKTFENAENIDLNMFFKYNAIYKYIILGCLMQDNWGT